MKELKIANSFIVSDVESVIDNINKLSRIKISDIEVIKKFIENEKNTIFYLDNKLNSKMQYDNNCVYVWLDTGLVDYFGKPIFISMHKMANQTFCGYYVGPCNILCKAVKAYYGGADVINRNLRNFISKYELKASARINKNITNENDYFVKVCNRDENLDFTLSNVMHGLFEDYNYEKDDTELLEPLIEEKIEKSSLVEDEITINLLFDKLKEIQHYVEELQTDNEKLRNKCNLQDIDIEDRKTREVEYNRVLIQMRNYWNDESNEDDTSEQNGHKLLKNKKILVIGGSELGENVMLGIAKNYGFKNTDFVIETDYEKIVNYAGRIKNDNRYFAIIIGSCPHKVSKLGNNSSLIEKLKNETDIHIIDARNDSGKLKLTKESYKKAITFVCDKLLSQEIYC